MADIFLSYASDDRAVAVRLAQVLEKNGWSVFWDRKIPPGKTFVHVIDEAITAAKCMVVVWTASSVESEWVGLEAAEGWR